MLRFYLKITKGKRAKCVIQVVELLPCKQEVEFKSQYCQINKEEVGRNEGRKE
jgi:hypothetical protein